MNAFILITAFVLYVLAFLCFLIPYKCAHPLTGKITGLALLLLISLPLTTNFKYFGFVAYGVIVLFQIVFIAYWTLYLYNKRKAARITAFVLTVISLLLLLQPWISDWTFNKNDVRKLLSFHGIQLNDDFSIQSNESGGIRDFYQTFTIRISDGDFGRIAEQISAVKDPATMTNINAAPAQLNSNNKGSINSETDDYLEKEYISDRKMDDGTYHFVFRLSKKSKELMYTGSDE